MKVIKEPSAQPSHVLRIDSKYVNNPELSDVTFRLVNFSFKHKYMLKCKRYFYFDLTELKAKYFMHIK